ncbi:unnamed protein product [Mytilus coruscus]|uniref:Uncharacterized protein n=1 Tax=Mytilus coruscus TaxID=42192 RepID=A0A6J8BRW9_MYTCO|nr:unnamed protein product [Mytilus coruscus]
MDFTIWFIIVVMLQLSRNVESSMKATVCIGNIFSLSCGNDQYILHILYEQYSYSATDKCHYDPSHCSQAEIINPVSAQQCNGYMFYDCFSKPQMIDVCKPYNAQSKQKLYLKSPNYPGDKLDPANCRCNITGRNITAEIYDHQKSNDSPVVFMFVTNKATINVNDVKIRSEIIFSDMDSVELLLDNQYKQEVFKLWMEITGSSMNILCMSYPTVMPSTPQSYKTVLYTSFISDQKPSIQTYTEPIKTSQMLFVSTSFHQSDYFSFQTITDHSVFLSTDSSWHNTTESLQILVTNSTMLVGNSHQADVDTDLRVIIIAVIAFTIIIIIFVSIGIFVHRKNHRQDGRFNVTEQENDRDVYHAYNFRFQNKNE